MRTILGSLAFSFVVCGGCGSNTTSSPDARQKPETTGVLPDAADCVCDEVTMGEHYCIINPCGNVGNGTVVARQNAVPYQTCKQ